MGSYILDRTKVDGSQPDTSTCRAIASRLSVAISDILGFNINMSPAFKMYESAKISKLKLCKTQLGNGLGANQSDKLENEEVLYLFRYCHIYIKLNFFYREFHKIIFSAL